MHLTFNAIADDADGGIWQGLFDSLWPAYRRWYLREGNLARPTYLACRRALERHMPEFVPRWKRLAELAGESDVAARFLSLWCPPAYDSACSQAVWPGEEPLLVRNYDYSARYFDALALHTRWLDQRVLGTSDCLVGLLDGINESGLAVSLTFGGRSIVGEGFGVPIVLRYVLETCANVKQASAVLARIPVHMAYNVSVLDSDGQRATVYLAPDRQAEVSNSPVATNHQPGQVLSSEASLTATIERERFLLGRLMLHEDPPERFISAFLRPPLFSLAYERQRGTLYTAALWPRQRKLSYHWPHAEWALELERFEPGSRRIVHRTSAAVPH